MCTNLHDEVSAPTQPVTPLADTCSATPVHSAPATVLLISPLVLSVGLAVALVSYRFAPEAVA
jgi:hypothetical protein